MNSQLVLHDKIQDDAWQVIELPAIEMEIKKQAGKVVQFKLTGEDYPTQKQIEDTVVPEKGHLILPLKVFLHHKEALDQRLKFGEIAIWIYTHEEIEKNLDNGDSLNQFPLIAIKTEKFADGRIFSIAARIRNKFHFKNDLRAMGDVLKDQLYFLKRVGFSSYMIRADRNVNDAISSLKDFSDPYQGAYDLKEPVWRRKNR